MAHTFRQKSQVNDQTGNPVSHNHTPGAAATVCVLTIVVAGSSDRTGGAPTIDGVTAQQVGTPINATECSIETWYVCKAFSGSLFSVSVPNAGGLSISLEVVTGDAGTGFDSVYNDFDEETQTGNVNGMTLTPSVNAVGDFVVSRVGSGEAAPASITCAYGTETYGNDHGAFSSKGRYFVATGTGAQSIPWVWSSDDGCGQAVVFKSVAGTTPKTIADSGAGADALSLQGSPNLVDGGSGSEAQAVAAVATLLETGGGADALVVAETVAKTLADSGAGADVLSLQGSPGLADTGIGSDTQVVFAVVDLPETGSVADAMSVAQTVAVSLADSGAGADAKTIAAAVILQESAAGVDAMSVEADEAVGKTLVESGSGTEVQSISATTALVDSGSGADAKTIVVTIVL